MSNQYTTRTAEAVTAGHPDKVCDQISDAVVDDLLAQDPESRVAIECLAATGMVLVAGQVSTKGYCDIPSAVRRTIRDIGYGRDHGFAADSCAVLVAVDEQSPEIAKAVSRDWPAQDIVDHIHKGELGAGDQGTIYGYATDESEVYFPGTFMPLPFVLAQRMAQRLSQLNNVADGAYWPLIGPDGKTQVSVLFDPDGLPIRLTNVVISTMHEPVSDLHRVTDLLHDEVLLPVVPKELYDEDKCDHLFQPSGAWTLGGPQADTGLTGRKLMCDTYGGAAAHGGGALSGKDPTKVDRSAAYYLRWIAKNVVAAGLAHRCQLCASFAIGYPKAVAFDIETFGTEQVDMATLIGIVGRNFGVGCAPARMIEELGLRAVRYQPTAAYGAFGRTDLDLPWEQVRPLR